MKETILKIEELEDNNRDGFVVKTTDQEIILYISNERNCCEEWGYFITNDEIDSFIGAEILDVNIVNECLEVSKAPKIYEGGIMYVNIETSEGTLQFTAYNEHSGYYSHSAAVVSTQLRHDDYL